MYEEMAFKMGPQNRSLTRRFEATSTQGKGALKRKDLDGKSKELKGQSLCPVQWEHSTRMAAHSRRGVKVLMDPSCLRATIQAGLLFPFWRIATQDFW